MIKKFIDKLLGRTAAASPKAARSAPPRFGKREEVAVAEHGIDPKLVDDRAATVVRTLKQAGYEAYIVGGAVRDLLLHLRPKDFDVATNATPEQVKTLFRRAFIIGRRFRIVHVVFGRGREHEVIEVSTFRAYMDNAAAEQVAGNERTSRSELAGMKHAVDASGRVLRDNVWGPQQEDAARRDFTINAMYYDPETQMVVDYHGGIKDAGKLTLRMIGDPVARYREDPVRIIRAVRFAAKLRGLGFKLEKRTAAPLVEMRRLLADVPQSRLFDEMLKLLQTGHSLATIEQLEELGLGQGIYPLLDLVVERARVPFVRSALQDTDRRVGEGKPVAPSFLLACVLWSDVRDGWNRRMQENLRQPAFPALQEAIDEVFHARIGEVSGGGKLASDMRDIWMMQPRFDKRTGTSPLAMVEQPRFRAAFDFMRLRAENGEVEEVLADWWQDFSMADDNLRRDMVDQVRAEQTQRQRAPRPARAVASDGGAGDAAGRAADMRQTGAPDRGSEGSAARAPLERGSGRGAASGRARPRRVEDGAADSEPEARERQPGSVAHAQDESGAGRPAEGEEGAAAPRKRRRRRRPQSAPLPGESSAPSAG